MSGLEEALALRADGEGRWLGVADRDHESANGMFGGWTAALCLAAVRRSAEPVRQPSALTVNFVSVVPPGEDVVLAVERLGATRSLEHWRADLRTVIDGTLRASALAVLSSRRDSDGHVQPSMPSVPDPEQLEEFHAPGTQGLQTLLRPILMEYGTGDTTSMAWVRELSGRPVDHLTLAYLADQFPPRSFFWGGGPRPSATLTMSVYFHATPEELAAVGDDYICNEAVGSRGESSTSGQHARQWSRTGTLLATSEQLAWYR